MSVLLTRPRADSERIAGMLSADGVESLIWPLTEIVFCDAPVDVPVGVEGLVFSSSNAVTGFCRLSDPVDLPVFCVGDRTATLARESGFPNVQSADGDFDALVTMIGNAAPTSVLYFRGRNVTQDLNETLATHGIACESRVVYAAEPSEAPDSSVRDALAQGLIRVITVWSARNAALLRESLMQHPTWQIREAILVGISENAVAGLGNAVFRRIIVASRPNATQMVAEIRAAVRY